MSIFTSEDSARNAAAVKAGLRTAAQTARGTGAALVASIGASLLGVDWLLVLGTLGAGIVGVIWAGLDAYLDVVANGTPAVYADAAALPTVTWTEDERAAQQATDAEVDAFNARVDGV